MTKSTKLVLATIAALSALSFTSTAHAADAFNKYSGPAIASAPLQVEKTSVKPAARIHQKSKSRIKRVIEPLPSSRKSDVRPSTDAGTINRITGFNKKLIDEDTTAKAIPIFVGKSAQTAR